MLTHRVLLSEEAITRRVNELAKTLARDVPAPDPIIIGLLTGSFVLVADLGRALARLGLEPQFDFLATSHYGAATTSSGTVSLLKDCSLDVRGRPVLLVDDILDSGRTLRLVRDHLARRQPSWLRTCVLLDKPSRRVVEFEADYVGFEIADDWVIGYGLDAGGQGRALPYIGAVE